MAIGKGGIYGFDASAVRGINIAKAGREALYTSAQVGTPCVGRNSHDVGVNDR